MSHDDEATKVDRLAQQLSENFILLADEVQLLSDRKTILEHKLRFAHEQYQYLADKYAPADPEIYSTISKLQLPLDLEIQNHERATFVPLPTRRIVGSKQQIAEAIRDGRIVAHKLASIRSSKKTSPADTTTTASPLSSANTRGSQSGTSITTVLEQDFTVPGKMSQLQCPFAPPDDTAAVENAHQHSDFASVKSDANDATPHRSSDPICAALYAERHRAAPSASGSANRCPIRYLNQHSPEEVAKYFETHKHEIPRSHEVCVRCYQRNEEDIRKLDAKYGNIVSMLQGLGHMHQPLLPAKDDAEDHEARQNSKERVETWTRSLSTNAIGIHDGNNESTDEDREGRFDRPLKEIRVGESPSRPWGISIPFTDLLKPGSVDDETPVVNSQHPVAPVLAPLPTGKCPFGHGQSFKEAKASQSTVVGSHGKDPRDQPVFLQEPRKVGTSVADTTQMMFTGPVFIGYPVDQAVLLMQQWQAGSSGVGDRA